MEEEPGFLPVGKREGCLCAGRELCQRLSPPINTLNSRDENSRLFLWLKAAKMSIILSDHNVFTCSSLNHPLSLFFGLS